MYFFLILKTLIGPNIVVDAEFKITYPVAASQLFIKKWTLDIVIYN